MQHNFKDRTGQVFNNMKVIEKDVERSSQTGRTYWKCKCLICGEIKSYRSDSLNSIKACKRCSKRPDLIGKKFGNLTVKELDIEASLASNKSIWVCQCDCGDIRKVKTTDLTSGTVVRCLNCTKQYLSESQREDLTGQHFGKLTVLKIDENSIGAGLKWYCKCDCGNITKVSANHLKTGHTKSCGCLVSAGELAIINALRDIGCEYKTQYTFSDLKGDKNYVLRFDFAIFKKDQLLCLIEFQGEQHYIKTGFVNSDERFQLIQKYDTLKKNYCFKYNIPLIEIVYNDLKNINKDFILNILSDKGIKL